MGLGRLVEAWNNYGIQMLVLMSLVLQLLLFILPIVRRHKMLEKQKYLARLLKLLLWLAYQLADTTAIYVLGHMVISSSSSHLSGEVMALWASLLLLHLGGQDTMTAYSLEDNQLWKRHLLTLLVQAAGVAYVLHGLGGAGGGRRRTSRRLRTAGALMFVAGFLKFVERIWVLGASDINKLFMRQQGKCRGGGRVLFQFHYTAPLELDSSAERAEEDLKQAHELLYFCIYQFVGHQRGLSPYQRGVIHYYAREKRLCELVHLKLSLMHDLLYTKAAAIHTWCGFLLRVFSWLATATTCTLVFLSGSSYGGRRLDAAVTNALLAGALLLETASSLKAAGSTWTYEILRSEGWSGIGCVVLAFRRLVRAAEWSRRRCPGYIGGQETIVDVSWWSEYGLTDPNTSLFVDEIKKMVTAYCKKDKEEKEKLMNSRGGLSLDRLQLPSLKASLEKLEFDEYLVIWYYATCEFNDYIPSCLRCGVKHRIDHPCGVDDCSAYHCSVHHYCRVHNFGVHHCGIHQLSRYMMYLFKKKPHMLPPPIRQKTCPNLSRADSENDSVYRNLVGKLKFGNPEELKRNLKTVLWVWIEMLCYAASHCDRESHAKELSNGSPELATVLWVVRAALINANMKPAVSNVAAASVRDKPCSH